MKAYRFYYRPAPAATLKSDIVIEAENSEEAKIAFEDCYPTLKYSATKQIK